MKAKHIALNILGYSTIAVVIFCTLTYFVWRVFPYKTISYLNTPFPVSKKVLQQGDIFTYHVDYCKYSNEIPDVKREFVDGLIFTAAEREAIIHQGCGDVDVAIQVPLTLPPGEYNLRITATYQPNWVRTILRHSQTESFTVLKKTGE